MLNEVPKGPDRPSHPGHRHPARFMDLATAMRPREHAFTDGVLRKPSFSVRDHFFAISGRTIALLRRHMAVSGAVRLPRAADELNSSRTVRSAQFLVTQTVL